MHYGFSKVYALSNMRFTAYFGSPELGDPKSYALRDLCIIILCIIIFPTVFASGMDSQEELRVSHWPAMRAG